MLLFMIYLTLILPVGGGSICPAEYFLMAISPNLAVLEMSENL